MKLWLPVQCPFHSCIVVKYQTIGSLFSGELHNFPGSFWMMTIFFISIIEKQNVSTQTILTFISKSCILRCYNKDIKLKWEAIGVFTIIQKSIYTFPWPIRRITIKENHIAPAVIKILSYRQTHRYTHTNTQHTQDIILLLNVKLLLHLEIPNYQVHNLHVL